MGGVNLRTGFWISQKFVKRDELHRIVQWQKDSMVENKHTLRIWYLNITDHIPARDVVYLKGFKECGAEIIDIRDSSPGLKKILNIYRRHRALKGEYDIVLVGYMAQILVPFARLITSKPVIFNALGTISEGVISRRQNSIFSLKVLYLWILDYLAFHSALLSLIDNNVLIRHIVKKFLVPHAKLLRAWTGVDEDSLFYDQSIPKLPHFTVLFRGDLANDSGIQHLAAVAKNLATTDIRFRILGRGPMAETLEKILQTFDSKNVEWVQERLSIVDLRRKMQETHLSIGWLSGGVRAANSVPHKTFESLALKLPFLQARQPAMLELFEENTNALFCDPDDVEGLTNIITALRKDPARLQKIAENGHQLFDRILRPKQLAQGVLDHLAERKFIHR